MNKKVFLITMIVLALAAVVLVFIRFLLPGLSHNSSSYPASSPEPTASPTPTPPKMKLELEFESEDDLKWFQFFEMNGDTTENSQAALIDGAIRFGRQNTFPACNIKYEISANQFVHFRTRSSGLICGNEGLERGLTDQSKAVVLGNCTDELTDATAIFNRDSYGDTIYASLPVSGSLPGFENEWLDEILWLNETGDQVFYVAYNPDNPVLVLYGSVALPKDWQYDSWGIHIGAHYQAGEGAESAYRDVDFIRIGLGSLKSYLYYFVPAYQENQAELDAFLETSPGPLPELLPAEQEGSQPEEKNLTEAESEDSTQMTGQTEPEQVDEAVLEAGYEPDEQVLTWPEPESILPYLVKFDELERCDGCEAGTAVYGVELSPFGYTFSVSFGTPPYDNMPFNSSYIKEWVQIYSKPIDEGELLDYYGLYSRILSYEAGEPIPFIYHYANAESNLMLFKENVLVTAAVSNAGNNYRAAAQIVKDTLARLPEEGLSNPEMAAQPSTELNAQAAEKFLETAWLGDFTAPSVPVDSLSGRVDLWLRLKAPAQKVEAAIYHPESRTYLTYTWMENPPADVNLAMTGVFSTKDTQSPHPYYLEYYSNPFLIRVWVNGELVSEFAAEGPK